MTWGSGLKVADHTEPVVRKQRNINAGTWLFGLSLALDDKEMMLSIFRVGLPPQLNISNLFTVRIDYHNGD